MNSLQATHGLTYVVISHDLSVVKYLSDRVGVMYLGKLVEMAPSNEIYLRPVHPYTLGLINAIPEPDPQRERAKNLKPIVGELPSAMNPPSGCRFRTRCPRAQDLCAEEEPPLRLFGPGHVAACRDGVVFQSHIDGGRHRLTAAGSRFELAARGLPVTD